MAMSQQVEIGEPRRFSQLLGVELVLGVNKVKNARWLEDDVFDGGMDLLQITYPAEHWEASKIVKHSHQLAVRLDAPCAESLSTEDGRNATQPGPKDRAGNGTFQGAFSKARSWPRHVSRAGVSQGHGASRSFRIARYEQSPLAQRSIK